MPDMSTHAVRRQRGRRAPIYKVIDLFQRVDRLTQGRDVLLDQERLTVQQTGSLYWSGHGKAKYRRKAALFRNNSRLRGHFRSDGNNDTAANARRAECVSYGPGEPLAGISDRRGGARAFHAVRLHVRSASRPSDVAGSASHRRSFSTPGSLWRRDGIDRNWDHLFALGPTVGISHESVAHPELSRVGQDRALGRLLLCSVAIHRWRARRDAGRPPAWLSPAAFRRELRRDGARSGRTGPRLLGRAPDLHHHDD